MSTLFQDALVTVMALAAVALLLRRLVGTVRPRSGAPACAGCASGTAACTPRAKAAVPVPPPQPAVFLKVRPPMRDAAREG